MFLEGGLFERTSHLAATIIAFPFCPLQNGLLYLSFSEQEATDILKLAAKVSALAAALAFSLSLLSIYLSTSLPTSLSS